MNRSKFKHDLGRNTYVSVFRKKRWAFYFLRKGQATKSCLLRKACAFGKKIAFAGTGCELPFEAIGGGLRMPHLNGVIVSPVVKIGEDCTIFSQITLGVNGRKSLDQGPILGR